MNPQSYRPATVSIAATRPGRLVTRSPRRWKERGVILVLVALVVLPIGIVLLELLTPTRDIWNHLWDTVLPVMIRNTLFLVVGVGLGTAVLGTGLAWLVTAYRFPGRDIFDWALMLPMALPSYILAFVYIATFDFVGIVQSTLRSWFGPEIRFPNIYSGWSAVAVLTATLYPYVYLLARSAFRAQSAYTFDVARTMGLGRTTAFFRLVLPLARPALVAGTSLAVMEALGDFATVRFFNYPTLSEGVFRIWEGMMNRAAAMEVAGLLCTFALILILLERGSRRDARYTQTGGRAPGVPPVTLRGARAAAATWGCCLVLVLVFVLPTIQLSVWTLRELVRQGPGGTLNVAFQRYMTTTATLAALAAAAAVVWALLLAHSTRLLAGKLADFGTRLATLGYAMPGAVIGVGALLTVTAVDRAVNRWGIATGLVLTGSVAGLVYAYVVRFLAVAHNSVDAALASVAPTLGEAARTMGAGPLRVLRRIHIPLISRGMFAGAALVFVDVMKELPVTLLLRPFGMDTLAIWAYLLAAEGFWEAAAVPSLSILVAGLVPVFILVRLSGGGRYSSR
ncbi:MAG: iron ABC transporter permease [Spirochaetales bacterium]|nr:iron ABC transporter permease [Spirochaetales bacterium]